VENLEGTSCEFLYLRSDSLRPNTVAAAVITGTTKACRGRTGPLPGKPAISKCSLIACSAAGKHTLIVYLTLRSEAYATLTDALESYAALTKAIEAYIALTKAREAFLANCLYMNRRCE